MKKIFSMMAAVAVMVVFSACNHNEPVVPPPGPEDVDPEFYIEYQDADGSTKQVFFGDPTVVTIDEINEMTGQLSFEGSIVKVTPEDFMLDVIVTRTVLDGTTDELCLSQCEPGNGELTQTFSDSITANSTPFYAHLTPVEAEIYTIEYRFKAHNRNLEIRILVNYDASDLEK